MKSSIPTKAGILNGFKGLRAAGLLVILLVVQINLVGQTTIYIDPTNTATGQNGSYLNPYSSWSQVTFTNGNTYLQKRGTTFSTTGNITITGRSNITLGAYDSGERPKIIKTTSGGYIVDMTTVSNCVVRDLEISSTANATSAIIIDGYGTAISPNNLVDNCDLHSCEWGVRIISQAPGNRILNSIIHNTGDDGVYAKDITDIEIGYCHIYDVNMKYFVNPNQSYSPGDNIQLVSLYDLYFNIHHNTLDHSSSGNKFCFIAAGETYTGLIEYNTMIGNSGAVTSCLYFGHTSGTVIVRYNTLQDGNYGIYSYVYDLQLHYNKIVRNNQGVTVMTNHNLTAKNNVFYNNVNAGISSISNTSVTSNNNIFYLSGSNSRAYSCNSTIISNYNNFNTQQANFLNGHSTLASWQSATGNDLNSFIANPLFVNPVIDDYCLQPTSTCINSGTNVGLTADFFGTPVPQASGPDVGIHEVITSTGNQPPVISNQTFSIAENSSNSTLVGQVVAYDPNAGQTITYSITSGNSSNAFTINSNTGALTVANSSALNYESIQSFPLIILVQDNGTGNLTASATITVNLTNVNEVPVMSGQTFSVNENSIAGTQVGSMVATDPDQGQVLSYSITSGNTNSAFAINASTGAITVNSAAALNFENQQSYLLVIRAQDNGTPVLNATANAQINVVNVNENPVVNNQTFSIPSYSPNGTEVGTVVASDPDLNQTLSYSITAGNTGTAFAINTSTGVITVINTAAVNYLTNPVFSLTVRVQDNGSPVLASFANITINVTPTNTPPNISNQSFAVNENSPVGTVIGQVAASDPDPGQTLAYSIISGNTGNTFQISATGLISVANSQLLNFENQAAFQLLIQVTDNGVPPLASSTNISIAVNNVNESPVIALNQAYTIAEHVPAGTQVGIVSASDPDNGQNLTYSILSGNTNNAFAISSTTGMISVSGTVCFEACSQYSLNIRVTDNGTPVLLDEEIISISLTDINENPVVNNQSFLVTGFAPIGTSVGTVVASDPDLNQTLNYTITAGNTSTAFSIQASTGIITVANSNALNYITNPVFNLTVRVQDNGTPVLESFATMTISVTPVNSTPVISNQAFTANENTPLGVIIGHVAATDPDPGQTLSFALISGNTAGAFQLGASGVLSIANPAAINFESNPVFQLNVSVTDNGQPQLSASAVVTVTLMNVNEAPSMAGNQNLSVGEHAAPGTYIGTSNAVDPDAGQTLSYSIVSGNTNNAFAISATTGIITVSGNINFETTSQYSITVRASDNGTPALWSEQLNTIQVNDVNEQPVINNQGFTAASFAPNGTLIGTVIATDPDLNQTLTYSIQSGNTNGAFALNASTGALTVANSSALNPETNPAFTISVRVQDNGNPLMFSVASVTVTINGQNSAPVIAPQAFTINENLPAGSIVGTVQASDPNAGQTLVFSIVSGNSGNAFIISQSGILSVSNAQAIDFETNPSFTLMVKVADNGSPALWAQAAVTVTVVNVNDPPVMQPQTYVAKENIPSGRYVCKVIATDQDPGDTFQSYIMAGNTNNAFKMQAYTSRIFVDNASALNFEVTPVYYLTVRCVDNHGAYSEQIITINIEDVNEAPVVLNQNFTVSENAPNGTLIGKVEATDPDHGQVLRYTITAGNTNGIFAVDLNSGNLTVANSTALQNSTANTFVLTVKVRDNGSPVLYSNGFMTITVIRNKESGELISQSEPERLNLQLSVYPNPSADGIFNIRLKEETLEETTLTITDLTGKKVGEASFSGMMNYRFDLGYLPSGVYLMHAQNAQKHSVSKLIKQ
ncbi:MAG: cadherin domain-containing protein [Bacteroidota bacterium]